MNEKHEFPLSKSHMQMYFRQHVFLNNYAKESVYCLAVLPNPETLVGKLRKMYLVDDLEIHNLTITIINEKYD